MDRLTLDDIEIGMYVNITQLFDIMNTMVIVADLNENDVGKIVYIGLPDSTKSNDLCEELRKNNVDYYRHYDMQTDWSEEDFNRKYKVSSFAKRIDVSVETLESWNKSGKLKPEIIEESGEVYYTESQYWDYARLRNSWYPVMLFGSDMDKLKEYAEEQGYEYKVFDKSFEDLMEEIARNKASGVMISSKDSIPFNCFGVFESVCSATSTIIEILDDSECKNDIISKIIKILETYDNDKLQEFYNKL